MKLIENKSELNINGGGWLGDNYDDVCMLFGSMTLAATLWGPAAPVALFTGGLYLGFCIID